VKRTTEQSVELYKIWPQPSASRTTSLSVPQTHRWIGGLLSFVGFADFFAAIQFETDNRNSRPAESIGCQPAAFAELRSCLSRC